MRAIIALALALTTMPIHQALGVTVPIGMIQFCEKHADECRQSMADGIHYTPNVFASVARLNRAVNRRIEPAADIEELWSILPEAGDCDDYVMTKRHFLIEAGYPQSALRMAMVRTQWGEMHLVLVIVTDKGQLVLDNLTDKVLWIGDMEHTLVKISTTNPLIWHNR